MARSTRFIAAVAFLAVGVVFAPDIFGSTTDSPAIAVSLAKLAHLLCFATSFGASVWVTFIGGIIMFNMSLGALGGGVPTKNRTPICFVVEDHKEARWTRVLPRHQFGNLQSKMFPVFFTLVSVCALSSVAAFAYLHPWKFASSLERYQLGFLLSSLSFSLSNLLVFTPMTVEVMKKRHKIERELGVGEEIGWSKNMEVANVNPKLASMNNKFRMVHSLSSLANVLSFGSLAMHSWYLAGKIQL